MKLSLAVARLSIAPVRNSRRKAGIPSSPLAPARDTANSDFGDGGAPSTKSTITPTPTIAMQKLTTNMRSNAPGRYQNRKKATSSRYRTGSVESPMNSEGGGEIPALHAQGYQRVPGRRSDALSRAVRAMWPPGGQVPPAARKISLHAADNP